MKRIIIIFIFASVCLALENVQIYILGNNHTVALYENTSTNVPERVVIAEVKTRDGISKIWVLREFPFSIKRVNLKNKKLSVVTNKTGFIYHKLQELTDGEKKIYHK